MLTRVQSTLCSGTSRPVPSKHGYTYHGSCQSHNLHVIVLVAFVSKNHPKPRRRHLVHLPRLASVLRSRPILLYTQNRYRNIHDASDAEMDNNTYRGLLFMDLQQPALSHTVLKEVEPVEIATIIGSIGGAWGKQLRRGIYKVGK